MLEARGSSREELPLAQGQGHREEPPPVPGEGRRPGRATPHPRPGAAAWRSNCMPETRDGGQEDQPHIQEW